MKTRPMILNGEEVRAVQDNRKTQFRRVVKPQPEEYRDGVFSTHRCVAIPRHELSAYLLSGRDRDIKCPFGVPGDRLWVRETFCEDMGAWNIEDGGKVWDDWAVYYRADESARFFDHYDQGKVTVPHSRDGFDKAIVETCGGWRPSIHMPKWASRITLEVTDVRVERVQEIDILDALAEGIEGTHTIRGTLKEAGKPPRTGEWVEGCPVDGFHELWDSINAKSGHDWDANPFVWCVSFKRIPQQS